MEKLYKGIHTFRETLFRREKDFFQRLSEGQAPEVLFITCADSRIDPNLVTQSKPGELFIVRNVGNIVPPHDAIRDKNSVAAAIEFAVLGLKVKDIIVCGHANCGAMSALHRPDADFDSMPHLRDWLYLARPVRDIANRFCPDYTHEEKVRFTEQENVLFQLKNIMSYPFVAEALESGSLHLHGWYYDIGRGDIFAYEPDQDRFVSLKEKK